MSKKLPSLHDLLIQIRKGRENLDFTQQEVADRLGKNQSTYNKLENGQHQLTHEEFLSLLEILEIDIESLLTDLSGNTVKNNEYGVDNVKLNEIKKAILKILNNLP